MKSSLLGNNYRYAAVLLSVVVTVFMVFSLVSGATTISTNINTAGTLTVSGASTLTGTVSAGGALSVTGITTLTGAVNASSTVNADGNLTIAGRATTTAASGNFAAAGTIGSGTSTPQGGDIAVTTVSATTTLYIAAETSTKGGCIQVKGPGTTVFRLYATAAGVATWEAGTCK